MRLISWMVRCDIKTGCLETRLCDHDKNQKYKHIKGIRLYLIMYVTYFINELY